MGIESSSPQIITLRQHVEAKFGRKPCVPADFVALADNLRETIKEHISPTTLERVWNYSTRSATTLSAHTLNLLSKYIDRKDWSDYCQSLNEAGIIDSDMIDGVAVYSDSLSPGDRLQLGWVPDRNCIIEYLGDYKFIAISCENSTLRPGDTFKCLEFILHEPAIMDQLIQAVDPNKIPKRYVAGKVNGLSYIKKKS